MAKPPNDDSADFERRLRDEKLESLKRLAYGASHEINNPLANIASRAQALLIDEKNPDRRHELATIYAQAMRGHEMIADLMLFARPPQPVLVACDLDEIATAAIAQMAPFASEQQTLLVYSPPSKLISLQADANQLTVALVALVRNALEAVQRDGQVELALACDSADAIMTVRDTGPGIPPEMAEMVFDPFYSGREAGRGLGFGLSKCWTIAQAHGGEVFVEQNIARGAQLVMKIPLRHSSSTQSTSRAS